MKYTYLVLIFTCTNLLLAFVLPIIRLYKSTGVFPVNFNKADVIQSFIGKVYGVCLLLLFISAICLAFFSEAYLFLNPFTYLTSPAFYIPGLILNQLAVIWIMIGQKQMENSWRIGIYDNEKNKLIISGMYKYSRHPIFLGLMLLLFSSFMCMPNAITFAICVVGFVLIQIEAHLEEIELTTKHGEEYLNYCKKTNRWINIF